jgi:predicted ATPase/class 3 adenylate cyclase
LGTVTFVNDALRSAPSGTVSFFFTDVEGSTQRWEHGPDEMAERLERHDAVMRRVIADHGGYVFSIAGDSFGASFPTVHAAVEAAVAAQRDLREVALPVRIGIHVGEAQERDRNYFGRAVNRTARIMSVGHGGQILLSDPARSMLDAEHLSFVDLGEHRLKDLEGRSRIWQVVAAGLPRDFPPLRSGGVGGNVPAQRTALIGRRRELELASGLLAERRLVTMTGPSGIGKTRLATEIGAAMIDAFPDGVWFVDLSATRDEAAVVAAVVASMQLPATLDVATGVAAVVAQRHSLVILDNCEQVSDEVAAFVEDALAAAPEVRFLATSLGPLEVLGEQQVRLQGLDEDTAAGAGVELFVDRARLVAPAFEATDEDRAVIASICDRVDGLPLAIEMAAARIGVLSPEEIDARLADRFDLLVGSRRGADRHRTLRATIDWTVGMLTTSEAAVLESLAVFRGPFTLEAAEHVASAALDGGSVLDVVAALSARSLVADQPGAGHRGMAHTLSQSVGAYCRQRLEEDDAWPAVRRRHLDHYVGWADSRKAWHVTPLRDEHADVAFALDNVTAAFEFAQEIADSDAAHRLVIGIASSLCFLNPELADRLLSALEAGPPPSSSELADRRELARARQGQVSGAFTEVVERCEALAKVAGDEVLAAATNLLANTLAGDTVRARELAGEARLLFEARGDAIGVYDVDVTLSAIELYECDPVAALGRDLGRVQGSLHGHYNLLGALAMVGDHLALRHELELISTRDLPLTYDYQHSLLSSFAHALCGDGDAARDELAEAIRLVRRTPVPLCAEECLLGAAFVERHVGSLRRAAELLSAFRHSGAAPFRTAPAVGIHRMLRRDLAHELGPVDFDTAWRAGATSSVTVALDRIVSPGP